MCHACLCLYMSTPELFDSFECLNELELSLNGIIKAEVTRGSFKHLQVGSKSMRYVYCHGFASS